MLLEVHSRHAIKEAPLQPQGDGRAGRLFDGVACLGDVDTLYGLAVEFAVGGIDAEIGNQPVVLMSVADDDDGRVRESLPDRRDAILRAREN